MIIAVHLTREYTSENFKNSKNFRVHVSTCMHALKKILYNIIRKVYIILKVQSQRLKISSKYQNNFSIIQITSFKFL